MIRNPRVAGHATWRDIAACRHHDPELFFPIAAARPALDQVEQAKQVCQR
jgi:WhiB family redox-sensing transcriptional regulator